MEHMKVFYDNGIVRLKLTFLPFFLLVFVAVLSPAYSREALLEYEAAALNPVTFTGYSRIYRSELKQTFSAPELGNESLFKTPLTVFYPVLEGEYPLIIISHGWKDSKRPNAGLARYLASQGYVAAILSAKQNERPEDFVTAFETAYTLLKAANNNPSSRLFNRIDRQKTAVIGHSMGGTAALHFTKAYADIRAVVALNPYNGASWLIERIGGKNEILDTDLTDLQAPALILTGSNDTVAYPEKTFEFYKRCNGSVPSAFLSLKEGYHASALDKRGNMLSGWFNMRQYVRCRLLILGWLDLFLKQTVSAASIPYVQPESFESIKPWLHSGDTERYPAYIFRNFPYR